MGLADSVFLRQGGHMEKPRVMYIMGAAHSGSTILGIALGMHPNVEMVGELHKLPRFGWMPNETRRCACHAPLFQCPFWCEVYRCWCAAVGTNRLADYIRLQQIYEHPSTGSMRVWMESRAPSHRFADYADMTAALYTAIRSVSGKRVIVDSSKSPTRSYALLRTDRLDLRLIHLVRDGRGVVWSKKRPRKQNINDGVPADIPAVPVAHTSRGWVTTNLRSEWVARQAGVSRARRLLYEQLTDAPDALLQEVGSLLSEDLSQVAHAIAAGTPIPIGHVMAGNHIRMADSVVVTRQHDRWAWHLSPRDLTTFRWWAGWLARRYGYQPQPAQAAPYQA
jgi:hypothetical protein